MSTVTYCNLGWLEPLSSVRLDATYRRAGKPVALFADTDEDYGPRAFQIRRYHARLMWLLRHILPHRFGEPLMTMGTVQVSAGRFIGQQIWIPTAPPGFNQAKYYFRDDHDCYSSIEGASVLVATVEATDLHNDIDVTTKGARPSA